MDVITFRARRHHVNQRGSNLIHTPIKDVVNPIKHTAITNTSTSNPTAADLENISVLVKILRKYIERTMKAIALMLVVKIFIFELSFLTFRI
jgi:hypothetical protein